MQLPATVAPISTFLYSLWRFTIISYGKMNCTKNEFAAIFLYSYECKRLSHTTYARSDSMVASINSFRGQHIDLTTYGRSPMLYKRSIYSSQHINESKVLHKYVKNEFLVACCSRQTKYFWKKFSTSCSPNIYAYFGTF